jgi:hypothetical protein
MKTLFVPVAGLNGLEALMDTVCLVAERFGSLIEGAHP